MSTNAKIKRDIQDFSPGELVELFDIDATNIEGGSTYHFCPGTISGTSVVFNGVTYTPLPAEVEGFEMKGEGQLPHPKIKVANINLTFAAAVASLNDLTGAKVTRRRTFKKYLDGQPEADSSAQFPTDIYYINRKTAHNKYFIEWELSAQMDFENFTIPKRMFLRDTCTHVYRVYVDGAFDYTNATCPYAGANYYTAEGAATTADKDECGRRLYDCNLRYPADSDELPSRAFPGLSRIGYPYR